MSEKVRERERERSRERGREPERARERERSKDRERERSPLAIGDGASRKQPPDRRAADLRSFGEDPLTMPGARETEEAEPLTLQDVEKVVGIEEITPGGTSTMHKMPKTTGTFSGQQSLVPRSEEWMEDAVEEETAPRLPPLSYREALKPRHHEREDQGRRPECEETWDGYLLCQNPKEMGEGITVVDSTFGPIIDFTAEEQRRLEGKWGKSLIIKLLGGSIGFMQMRRRVQLMWGKSGTVELNDIGNGYMVATFQTREDYFFALEGGPWLIANHYLTVQT